MKNNPVLITAFGIAAGLMSSTAMAGGVDASASATAQQERQEVTMLTENGPQEDAILWDISGGAGSQVKKPEDIQIEHGFDIVLQDEKAGQVVLINSMPGDYVFAPRDYARSFENAAAFAPSEFRDPRYVTLDRLYPDDPEALLASRERPAFVIAPAVMDRVAMYQAPADYLDREKHVEDPTGHLQLAALTTAREAAMAAILPTLTKEERAALLKNSMTPFNFADESIRSYYKDSPQGVSLMNIDHISSDITADIATLKAQADQLIRTRDHTAFHLGDTIDIPTGECTFSPCIIYLTPSDVWDGVGVLDTTLTGSDAVIEMLHVRKSILDSGTM